MLKSPRVALEKKIYIYFFGGGLVPAPLPQQKYTCPSCLRKLVKWLGGLRIRRHIYIF